MRKFIIIRNSISQIYQLSFKRLNYIIILILIIFLNNILEVVTLSLVSPFASIIINDESINNSTSKSIFNFLQIINISSLNIYYLFIILIFLLLMSIITSIYLTFLKSYLSTFLRNDWIEKIYFNELHSSYYHSRRIEAGKASENISRVTQKGSKTILNLINLFKDIVLSLFILISLLLTNAKVVFALVFFIFFIYSIFKYFKLLKNIDRGKKLNKYNQKISSIVVESILNLKLIKVLNIYKVFNEKLNTNLKKYAKTKILFDVYGTLPNILIKYFLIAIISLLLMYAYTFNSGLIKEYIPSLSLIIVLSTRLTNIFGSLSKNFLKFSGGIANINLIHESIFNKEKLEDIGKGITLDKRINSITFEDLTFRWPTANKKKKIINNVNLKFTKGVNLIKGPSGCGKSTIASLLVALIKPNSGSIKFNNQDIISYTLESIRSEIILVSQEKEIINGTILENIKLGNLYATYEDVMKAAKRAHIHNFINQLPNGYETVILEGGLGLSGGQKQRIALSRVFLKRYSVYIFDEVTNELDGDTVSIIQDCIYELGKENIVIQISHLDSTLEKIDKVFNFQVNGNIFEEKFD